MVKNSLAKLKEPKLTFGHGQQTYDPRDGLFLFGPFSRNKISNINLGIIGTPTGIQRLANWLNTIQKPVKSLDNDIARPFFPGFESAFEVSINFNATKHIEIDPDQIFHFLSYSDPHVRVYELVNLYIDELIRYEKEEEEPVQVWFVVIPDEIYALCRPRSTVPVSEDSIDIGIKGEYARTQPQLFKIDEKLQEPYKFEKHFHNQLKARLLKDKIITQIVKEGTIAYKEILNKKGKPKNDLSKFESAIAWNLANALYYKVGGLPWKLAKVREGVCYVGLVYKRVETDPNEKTACCAAQMFLDSGDGLVFRGNIGPWYNPENNQFHLSKESAFELLDKAIKTYKLKNTKYPKEIFIHAKTYFNDEEWNGFVEACNDKSNIIGIRIRDDRVFKLFRDQTYPILRSMMYDTGNLWTRGFIPRVQTVLGLETPNPLSVEICKGDANIKTVCEDILALTKLNYNSCIYCDGKPVTLRFADMIGDVLTAGPKEDFEEVLPFKHYI
jgi:hypothetical protein